MLTYIIILLHSLGPLLDPLWQQCSRVNATNQAAWRSAKLLSLIAVLMVPGCAAPVLGRDEFAQQLGHGVLHGGDGGAGFGCMGDGRMGRPGDGCALGTCHLPLVRNLELVMTEGITVRYCERCFIGVKAGMCSETAGCVNNYV